MRRAVEALPTPVGLASFLLLFACLRWAHHWSSPRADALVASWAAATATALGLGVLLRGRGIPFVRLGVAFGLLSVLALAVAGLAWSAGYDPAGACGGG
jgi:hypothetical protein